MNSLRRSFEILRRNPLGERFYSFNQPRDGGELVRFGGITSLFRLPLQEDDPSGLDACFVGIPMDHACSNRSGTRLGPRAIRHESCGIHPVNITGACPFESLQVADIGDVPIVPYSIPRTVDAITEYFTKIMEANCIPLTMGGDHTISYPILRAIKEKHGTVGLVLVDGHTDLQDNAMGEKVVHGTPFRRAIEEDLIDPELVIQIGLRGSLYPNETTDIYDWAKEKGVHHVFASQCWHKSMNPLMEKVRGLMKDKPVYCSIDIDGIDCVNCPGTGFLEIAGLTPVQALEIVRGMKGLNIIGGDVVEINPQYDKGKMTSLMGANLLFELLCVLPKVKYIDTSFTRRNNWI